MPNAFVFLVKTFSFLRQICILSQCGHLEYNKLSCKKMLTDHYTSYLVTIPSLLPSVVHDVHSLVIRSVCHVHGGVYKSVISNKVGKATCYAHLYVTGNFFFCHLGCLKIKHMLIK